MRSGATFRELHEAGCFVVPNPWDAGSAKFLHHLGFRALATTSAGFGFSRGLPDAIGALTLADVLEHVREIVSATPLPVSADFQDGYGVDAEAVATNVAACLECGAAGVSIEDATGDPTSPLRDREAAIDRVVAACAARDAVDPTAVVTARCEAWLVGDDDPLSTAIDRLVEFAAAGADCLFAPGVRDPEGISAIVAAVAPKPVNVLVAAPDSGLTIERLAELGVRRVSVGSAFARAAWGGFLQAVEPLVARGSFEGLRGAATFDELNAAFDGVWPTRRR